MQYLSHVTIYFSQSCTWIIFGDILVAILSSYPTDSLDLENF